MDRQAIKHYLDAVWAVVADANRYFASEAPWAKRRSDPKRMETILYVAGEVVRQVAILAQPVTPTAAGRLLDLLAEGSDRRGFKWLGEPGRLRPGTAIPPPTGVFPRYLEPEGPPAKTNKRGERMPSPPKQG
jgi:methionyl-tRNA synthetase